ERRRSDPSPRRSTRRQLPTGGLTVYALTRKSAATAAFAALASVASVLPARAQDNTQFVGIVGYRIGQFASVGSGFYSGMVDYFNMINERDGGVNKVRLTWEECETEYNNA